MVAADAGPMQIQLREGAVLRCAEAVLQGTSHDAKGREIGLGAKSMAKAEVEETRREDPCGGKSER